MADVGLPGPPESILGNRLALIKSKGRRGIDGVPELRGADGTLMSRAVHFEAIGQPILRRSMLASHGFRHAETCPFEGGRCSKEGS
jgi:hypothetical protein